jgi:hypothetical protein
MMMIIISYSVLLIYMAINADELDDDPKHCGSCRAYTPGTHARKEE